MNYRVILKEWFPLILTIVLFVVVEYVTYVEGSKLWADLAGFIYVLMAPGVYRLSRRWIPSQVQPANAGTETTI